MTTSVQRVAIIGGGIIGRYTAYLLQTQGVQTTLFDNDPMLQAASWNNACHIATEQVTPLASIAALKTAPKRLFAFGGALDFNLLASGFFPFIRRYLWASRPSCFTNGTKALTALMQYTPMAWQRLTEHLALDGMLIEKGHWILWRQPHTAKHALAQWQSADTGDASFASLSAAELERAASIFSGPFDSGIQFQGSAQVYDSKQLALALQQQFVAAGGQWIEATISPLALVDGKATIPAMADEQFDQIIVCAGVHSAQLLQHIHRHIPLIAERGYHLEIDCDDKMWPADLPPVVFEEMSMIVTRVADRLRACSFVEFNSVDAKPDERKWAQLQKYAQAVGLPFDDDATKWVGCRPTLPDYLPAIGRSDKADNLVYAFGHQHLGLTLAAVTAELVTEIVTKPQSNPLIEPFSLNRFNC